MYKVQTPDFVFFEKVVYGTMFEHWISYFSKKSYIENVGTLNFVLFRGEKKSDFREKSVFRFSRNVSSENFFFLNSTGTWRNRSKYLRRNEWPKWIRRFERYRLASGLDGKPDAMQVNALMYAMGDEADDIMAGFGLTEEEREVYQTVKTKFDEHFVVRRNTIFERAKFNRRCQEEGENVDSYIT